MARSLIEARKKVESYIEPHDCFVQYKNSKEGYERLSGTPCAHYVSHQIGLRGVKGEARCEDGYLLRVRELVAHLGDPIDVADVQQGDVWARFKGTKDAGGGKEPTTHCGMVFSVTPATSDGEPPTIVIKHCSSSQKQVATNDWAAHFKKGGAFYRLPGRAKNIESEANLMRFLKGFEYQAPFRYLA